MMEKPMVPSTATREVSAISSATYSSSRRRSCMYSVAREPHASLWVSLTQ